MPKYRTLVRGDVFPASFVAALQEFVSAQSANLVIARASATTVSAPAGTGDAMVALGINGLWRYNTANVTATHPGGAAGVYDVLAVASANNFTNTPNPDTDNTDYSWGLQVVASGGAASGNWNGNAITASRKVAQVYWDGAAITSVSRVAAPPPSGVLPSRSVLDVGIKGQIRAGRRLAATDFSAMGLNAPVGLWNLDGLTDVSGNARALTNKGTVVFGGTGVEGVNTVPIFAGSTAQALYVTDASGGPFNFRVGTWGAWCRTSRIATQAIIGKSGPGTTSATGSYLLYINTSGNVVAWTTSGSLDSIATGATFVWDDRWHHCVASFDGTRTVLYLDGVVEAVGTPTTPFTCQQINEPLSIGASDADAGTTANPFYGRIAEAFVTTDVLNEDQVRFLYAAKIPHGFPRTPNEVTMGVRRRRRGFPSVGDFPTLPVRSYTFNPNGALTNDGSNTGSALTATNGPIVVAGADGTANAAYHFNGASSQYMAATDTGLPMGAVAASIGAWFKTNSAINTAYVVRYGSDTTYRTIFLGANGQLSSGDAIQQTAGPFVADGAWHFAVVVFTPGSSDGAIIKSYLDGRLVAWGSAGLAVTAAGGANGLMIGAGGTATPGAFFTGTIDGVFVTDYAMTPEQILSIYAVGSADLPLAAGTSPRDASNHVEAVDATNLYVVNDTLDQQHQVDLKVAA